MMKMKLVPGKLYRVISPVDMETFLEPHLDAKTVFVGREVVLLYVGKAPSRDDVDSTYEEDTFLGPDGTLLTGATLGPEINPQNYFIRVK